MLSYIDDGIDLKRAAAQSHRLVLRLNDKDANALFNAAQALCSLAEELDDDVEDERNEAISSLQEAIELFSACLAKQEAEFADSQGFFAAENAEADVDKMDETTIEDISGQTDSTEQTVQVASPITPEDLIDTALAELEALEQLLLLHAASKSSAPELLIGMANTLIETKLPHYLSFIQSHHQSATDGQGDAENGRKISREISHAIASWQASLSTAEYRGGFIDIHTLYTNVSNIFSGLEQNTVQGNEDSAVFSLRIARAEAFLSIARLLAAEIDSLASPFYDSRAEIKLRCLGEAESIFQPLIDSYPKEGARLMIECGDCCLKKLQICQLQGLPDNVPLRFSALLSEARGWYSKARETATTYGINRNSDGCISIGTVDEAKSMLKSEAIVKEVLSAIIGLNMSGHAIPDLKDLQTMLRSVRRQRLEQTLRDVFDDRLVPLSLDAVKDIFHDFMLRNQPVN